MTLKKDNEEILVVTRKKIFSGGKWQGINTEISQKVLELAAKGEFKRRGDIEENPSFQQIIPYIVFRYKDKYFLMQRTAKHDEKRLADMYSLGIGGHINRKDLKEGEDVFNWARREFMEEVDYKGNLNLSILGILNDDNDEVGKVHLGVVILAEGDTGEIQVRDEHKSGEFMFLEEASKLKLENWSKILVESNFLKKDSF